MLYVVDSNWKTNEYKHLLPEGWHDSSKSSTYANLTLKQRTIALLEWGQRNYWLGTFHFVIFLSTQIRFNELKKMMKGNVLR